MSKLPTGDANRTNEELKLEIATTAKELLAAQDNITEIQSQQKELLKRMHGAVDEERKSIALEVHDQLNASIIAMKLGLQELMSTANRLPPSEIANEIRESTKQLLITTAEIYNRGRSIVKRLRPETLDTLGLVGALQDMMTQFNRLHKTCDFSVNSTGDFTLIPADLSIAIFRLVQEAVSNSIKHSNASHVDVELSLDKIDENVSITIADDGCGLSAESIATTGFGLIGMRERVSAFSGSISFDSAGDKGLVVRIELPI